MVVEPEVLREVAAHGRVAVEQQQAGLVLVAEAQLALRAEDPLRLHAVDLLGGDDAEPGQRGAGRGEGGADAGARVRRAAHDAEALALARAHAAQHQVVATALAEIALDRLDLADHRAAQADRRQRRDAGDLDPRIDEAIGGVLRRELQVDELAHPAVRNPHANCLKNRRSFSKKRRMSSTPYLSIAMRSMPMPNAQPVTCSGS